MIARVLAVLTTVLVAAPLGAPSEAAPPDRSNVDTAFMVGRKLYLPDQPKVHLKVERWGTHDLLGRTSAGWVFTAARSYYVYADDGTVTELAARQSPDIPTPGGELLSSDRTSVVNWRLGAGEVDTTATMIGLDGVRRPFPDLPPGPGIISDAVGDRAYFAGKNGISELVVGAASPTLVTSRPARLVDLERDIAFLSPNRRRYATSGPVSFSAVQDGETPKLRWTAEFQPTRISANGRLVLGLGHRRQIQVRRMSDGAVVRSFPRPPYLDSGDYWTMGWNGRRSDAILTVVSPDRRGAQQPSGKGVLVLCPVDAGRCTRVTAPSILDNNLPTDAAGPWRLRDRSRLLERDGPGTFH